jgi:hypothetical protein
MMPERLQEFPFITGCLLYVRMYIPLRTNAEHLAAFHALKNPETQSLLGSTMGRGLKMLKLKSAGVRPAHHLNMYPPMNEERRRGGLRRSVMLAALGLLGLSGQTCLARADGLPRACQNLCVTGLVAQR